jgi:hypothetical protein
MRWEFLEPATPEDARRRARTLAAIDRWWAAFRDHAPRIGATFLRKDDLDVAAFMQEHLQPIDPRLMWEFGPALKTKGHRLVITPEGARTLRPMLGTLLAEAPELAGWEFYPYRLPDPPDALDMVEARTGRRPAGLKVRAAKGDGHRIDLTFLEPGHEGDEDEVRFAGFIATETVLGEEALDTWIGAIDASHDEGGEWLALTDLGPAVERLRAEIVSGLPSGACLTFVHEAEWAMLRLEPEEAEDYPDQRDLFVAKTADLERWRTAHSPGVFSSSRFSRVGETFCYVKIDGKDGLEGSRFEDKGDIEDALDAALIPAGLGAFVGGGSGLRYAYVDLALTDVRKGIDAVRRVLREGGAPTRSWILFCDDVWREEWVGIHDDTPPPPVDASEE